MIREGTSLRKRDDGFDIPLLPIKCLFPVGLLDLRPMGEHGFQSSARAEENAACSVLLIKQAETGSLEQRLIDTCMHELGVTVDTSLLHLLVRTRSGNYARIGKQEPPGRYLQPRQLLEKRITVTRMNDDIEADYDAE